MESWADRAKRTANINEEEKRAAAKCLRAAVSEVYADNGTTPLVIKIETAMNILGMSRDDEPGTTTRPVDVVDARYGRRYAIPENKIGLRPSPPERGPTQQGVERELQYDAKAMIAAAYGMPGGPSGLGFSPPEPTAPVVPRVVGLGRCPTCDSANPAVRYARAYEGTLECETECRDGWHGPTPAGRIQVAIAVVVAVLALCLAVAAIGIAVAVPN